MQQLNAIFIGFFSSLVYYKLLITLLTLCQSLQIFTWQIKSKSL